MRSKISQQRVKRNSGKEGARACRDSSLLRHVLAIFAPEFFARDAVLSRSSFPSPALMALTASAQVAKSEHFASASEPCRANENAKNAKMTFFMGRNLSISSYSILAQMIKCEKLAHNTRCVRMQVSANQVLPLPTFLPY